MNGQQRASFGRGILAGAIVGGIIALLYAPKSGRETRALIGKRFGGMRETVGGKVNMVRHTMGEKISGEECAPTGSSVSGDGA